MNLELFIAKKVYFKGSNTKSVSSPAVKVAIAGIALGMIAMILSVCIVVGFKREIREKIVGFGSHIQLTSFAVSEEYETFPIKITDELKAKLEANKQITHTEEYATKAGIIKTDTVFQGVIMKGVNPDFDWTFFQSNLKEGKVLVQNDTSTTNQALLSQYISDKLGLNVGDSFIAYFFQQESLKPRKFTISGIYSTGLEDYDKQFVITNLPLIQKLNNWDSTQVSGIELKVNDYGKLAEIKDDLYYDMASFADGDGNPIFTTTIEETNPMIFSWLHLIDTNVWVIIILMFAVSGFTMISGLLILILERTNMIGILKALGARNLSIRKVFIYISGFLIIKGMLWGNAFAMLIIILQKYLGIIKLDPATYYVSQVPIYVNPLYIILINIGTLIVSLAMMLGPSYLIARISPSKSIRFE